MSGNEYEELDKTLGKYTEDFEKIAVSKPLLDSDADKEAVAKELIGLTKEYDDGILFQFGEKLIVMGIATSRQAYKVLEMLR